MLRYPNLLRRSCDEGQLSPFWHWKVLVAVTLHICGRCFHDRKCTLQDCIYCDYSYLTKDFVTHFTNSNSLVSGFKMDLTMTFQSWLIRLTPSIMDSKKKNKYYEQEGTSILIPFFVEKNNNSTVCDDLNGATFLVLMSFFRPRKRRLIKCHKKSNTFFTM